MSLYKRNDSPHWWVKISHSGRKVQRSTGTEDKCKAQEYHDKLKVSLWEQQRLGVKPRRAWKEAVVRWLAETSEKAMHQEDIKKLRWLDPFLGSLMLDEITLDVIDGIKAEKLKVASKSTVNRYLALVRSILLRAGDEWEWIDKAPKVKLFKEGPGRERSITVKQAELLLGELPAHQRDVVVFALATGLAAVQRFGTGMVSHRPCVGSCLGGSASIQEPQADCCSVERDRTAGFATATRQAPRAGIYLRRKAAGDREHEIVEKSFETRRHRELPLARFEAHLGLLASPVGNADARAATARRMAVFRDG